MLIICCYLTPSWNNRITWVLRREWLVKWLSTCMAPLPSDCILKQIVTNLVTIEPVIWMWFWKWLQIESIFQSISGSACFVVCPISCWCRSSKTESKNTAKVAKITLLEISRSHPCPLSAKFRCSFWTQCCTPLQSEYRFPPCYGYPFLFQTSTTPCQPVVELTVGYLTKLWRKAVVHLFPVTGPFFPHIHHPCCALASSFWNSFLNLLQKIAFSDRCCKSLTSLIFFH